MPDINLLPEDLKKKQEKTFQKRSDFSLNEIEFTDGEKLKKYETPKIKPPTKSRFKKWFKPNPNKSTKVKEDFVKKDNKYFSEELDKQNPIEEFKEKFQEEKKSVKPIENKLEIKEEKQVLNSDPKSNSKPKIKKKKNIFGSLIKGWKGKIKDKKDDEEKREKGLDVNLLPFGSNVPTTRRMISILIIVFILSSVLVFSIYFAFYVNKEQSAKKYNDLEEEIDLYMKDTQKYDGLMKEITSWQEKVEKIGALLNKHVYWTEFFEKLEENTLADVEFLSFAGSVDGAISLEALAPDYQTVSKQWIRLKEADDFIKNVEINGASMRSSEDKMKISFSLTLEFVEGAFYKE